MTRVIERKLGRHKAIGIIAEPLTKHSPIEIDPRQTPKSYLDTLIHEKIHIMFPDWSENKVKNTATEIRKLLWNNGYRKVQLK